jgi:hypothetical protein
MFDRVARWWRHRSLDRSERAAGREYRIENADAGAAALGHETADVGLTGSVDYPPGYFKSYDEGRPPH